MPSELERTWQEVAASNRERIRALEREGDRTRQSLHDLRTEATAVRYLAEKVADLAGDVRDVSKRMEVIAQRAVHRPSQSALSIFGQYVGLLVAIAAIVLAATR